MNPVNHEYMQFVRKVLNRIKYKPSWKVIATRKKRQVFVHVEFDAPDAQNPGQVMRQIGRDFYLGSMEEPISADQIIGTTYLAIKTAEEHETDEFFMVDGVAVNNPHITTAARQEAFFHTFPNVVGTGTLAR